MDWDTLHFFDRQPGALPLYETLEGCILEQIPDVLVKIQKSQISFYHRRLFACASFLRVKKKKELPPCYLVVTVGLARRLDSPRVAAAAEPYPGRWTHHIVVSDPAEIDPELMGWIREAAAFAAQK